MSEFQSRLSLGDSVERKAADGFVVETRRMFHAASAALNTPALSPTRGSGLGALADMSGVGAIAGPVPVELEVAHAPRAINPIASERGGRSDSRFTGRLR